MRRPSREFKVGTIELEGRLLLTIVPAPPPAHIQPVVGFVGADMPGTTKVSQVVLQQDGEATVALYRYSQAAASQVVVATDPASPAVGKNVGSVDQTVTFGENETQATVTVPILANATNPGEVDVDLTITPVDPQSDIHIQGPLELRVLASKDELPPQIVSSRGTPQGIVLTFSKPLDPAAASDVRNYSVHSQSWSYKSTPGGIIGWGLFGTRTTTSIASVRLESARYDPATQTVTLVPKHKLSYLSSVTVSQGVVGRRGHPSNVGQGITDIQGHPINADSTPGKFRVSVTRA